VTFHSLLWMMHAQIHWRCRYHCWWNLSTTTVTVPMLPAGWKRPTAGCLKPMPWWSCRPSTITAYHQHCQTFWITFRAPVFPTNPVASSATQWVRHLVESCVTGTVASLRFVSPSAVTLSRYGYSEISKAMYKFSKIKFSLLTKLNTKLIIQNTTIDIR